jgi:hypothetical protein
MIRSVALRVLGPEGSPSRERSVGRFWQRLHDGASAPSSFGSDGRQVSGRHEVLRIGGDGWVGLSTSMTTMRPRWQAGHSINDEPVISS